MNIDSIIKTIDIFCPDETLMEVRCLKPRLKSGYFCDKDNMIKHLKQHKHDTWYFVMNIIHPDCYNREQREKIIQCKETTKDSDIIGNKWLLIDVDPVRMTGISASDAEKAEAKSVILKIYKFLRDFGFSYPIVADSGNGYHLLYRIELVTCAKETQVLKDVLKTIDVLFSNDKASVDTSVFNPARITKLYGTVARKGENTAERPHRESSILKVPDEIKLTSITLLEKLTTLLPKPKEKSNYYSQGSQKEFDIDEFISKHGIRVSSDTNYSGGRKLILDECVFNREHKGKDAAIFVLNNGAIGYKCFHNSCSDKTWQDVRVMFEPTAYEQKQQYQERYSHKTNKPMKLSQLSVNKTETKSVEEKDFWDIKDIEPPDRNKIITIPSGIKGIDEQIGGFNKGEFSLWSGSNSSGKSSVLSQMSIEAVQRGFKVAIFSGELTAQRLQYWLGLQAAGRQFVLPSQKGFGYYLPNKTREAIHDWLQGNIFIYNNNKGNKASELFARFEKVVKEKKVDMVILDNLMTLDLDTDRFSKYDSQSDVANYLSNFSKSLNVHTQFVCHPRKVMSFLRKNDISGSGDLGNAADNIFIVHRVNNDFKRGIKEFDPKLTDKYNDFGNVIEIAKNRDLGKVDLFAGVYFEEESRRFLNEKHENKTYSWLDNAGSDFIELPIIDLPFD